MRHKNTDWSLPDSVENWTQVGVAVLMDIRDELQELNRLFRCKRFLDVPNDLKRIRLNTTKRSKRKEAA